MKTTANGQATVKANNFESIAMPMGEYGDLCYDYYGKGSVIVFGNTDDHREQLEQMGGKYSDRLRYSALQNGRKWTEKQGRTAGYYFTTEQGKEQAVKYVQRVNHSIFDKYEQEAAKMGDRIQRHKDLKEGDRVRTIHGVGTVTAHEPKYNKRVSVCVKLDKFTYNYGWKGMPHTFIECRCDEVAVLQELSEIKAATKTGTAAWYREKLTKSEWKQETMYFEYFDVHHDCTVEVHKPKNDGTTTGDRWQTDITVWGDHTHDGTPHKEDAHPCTSFRTLDGLCKHLEVLHEAAMQLEDLTVESRNRLELERCSDRPTAWATEYSADEFGKLTSQYERADDDADIVGQRFETCHDDIFSLTVFVSDYAGNERHALIYILDGFTGKVSANVLPIDKLRRILTTERGWHRLAA